MTKVITINKIKIGRPLDSPINDVQYVLGPNVSETTKEYYNDTYTHKLSSSGDDQITTCTIKFNCTIETIVTIKLLSSSEDGFDFIAAGPLDDNTTILDSRWCRKNTNKSCSGYLERKTVEYNAVSVGNHFIRVVYAKDRVGNMYDDCGWFKFGQGIEINYVTPKSIILNNKDIMNIKINDIDYWKLEEYRPKFSIYLSGTGIGLKDYMFSYNDGQIVFYPSTKIDDDNLVINYDTESLTSDADNRFSRAITPNSWNNSDVTFKLVNNGPIDDRNHKGVEIFKELNVKKLDLTELDLTNSPNFNSFNNIFINLGTVNVVTGPKFDTRYVTTFEGAFAITSGRPVFDFSRSPNFKISESANTSNIFYGIRNCKFILNKNIDDYTKSVFQNSRQEIEYV